MRILVAAMDGGFHIVAVLKTTKEGDVMSELIKRLIGFPYNDDCAEAADEIERQRLVIQTQGEAIIEHEAEIDADKETIERLTAALERIRDMSERPVCTCGIQTGTDAIKSCANTALAAVDKGES